MSKTARLQFDGGPDNVRDYEDVPRFRTRIRTNRRALSSRHRQACIVVARGGLSDQLGAYPQTGPIWLGAATPQVDGWEANVAFLSHLERFRVMV